MAIMIMLKKRKRNESADQDVSHTCILVEDSRRGWTNATNGI